MSTTINYSLTPVSTEFTGGEKLWRANVQTNGTITAEELAQILADKTNQDVSLAKYFLEALNEELKKQLAAGYRVNLGQLATGFAIKGRNFTNTTIALTVNEKDGESVIPATYDCEIVSQTDTTVVAKFTRNVTPSGVGQDYLIAALNGGPVRAEFPVKYLG